MSHENRPFDKEGDNRKTTTGIPHSGVNWGEQPVRNYDEDLKDVADSKINKDFTTPYEGFDNDGQPDDKERESWQEAKQRVHESFTDDSKKSKKGIIIGSSVVAGLAVVGGTIFGVNATANKNEVPTEPTTPDATAPVVPGESAEPTEAPVEPEVTPSPSDIPTSFEPTPEETLDFTQGIEDLEITHEKMNVNYESFENWDSLDISAKVIIADEFFADNGVDTSEVAGINQNGEEMMEWFFPRYIAVQKLALDTSAELNEDIALKLVDTLALPSSAKEGSYEKYKERFGTLAYDSSFEQNYENLEEIYSYTDDLQMFSVAGAGQLAGKTIHYNTSVEFSDGTFETSYQERFAYREVINADGKIQGHWMSVLSVIEDNPMDYGDKPPIVLATPEDTY